MTPPANNKPTVSGARTTADPASTVSLRSGGIEPIVSARSEVRPVRANEIDQSLAVLLADSSQGPRQHQQRMAAFKKLAGQEDYDLNRQIVALQDGRIVHACLFVANPGASAFIFISKGDADLGGEPVPGDLAVETLRQTCRWAHQQGCALLQIMLDPVDNAGMNLCLHGGFQRLTDLAYMFRFCDLESPWTNYPLTADMSWIPYGEVWHDEFKNVIKQTYHASLDCPELGPLRDVDDVIAGHKAVGLFDPQYWKLLIVGQEAAGILLLTPSRSANAMELTYMGVVEGMRRKGMSKIILCHALNCARNFGAQFLALAVDCRNHPAYHLYTNLGFTVLQRRSVMYASVHQPVITD